MREPMGQWKMMTMDNDEKRLGLSNLTRIHKSSAFRMRDLLQVFL